jgi:deoxyribodipyrimidine photo-lyase
MNRIRHINGRDARTEARYVLYWMTAARRLSWNFALDRAVEIAAETRKPLVILEPLRCDYPWASARFHRFVLDGMEEHRAALAGTDVTYFPYVEPEVGAGRGLLEAMAAEATTVVTDDHPGFFYPRLLAAAAERLDVRLEAVDGCGLVPLRATERAFPTAHSYRRWLHHHLPDLLAERPGLRPLTMTAGLGRARLPKGIRVRWPAATSSDLTDAARLRTLPIDHSVPPVESIAGGSAAARRALRDFVRSKLARYADEANRPEAEATSGLSPWLHFGHLSPHEVFAAVTRAEGWSPASLSLRADGRREGWWGLSPGAESFLDQLVTWRELGHNAAVNLPDYRRWESLPEWARETLEQHAGDPREHVYTREQFERAQTHDPLWNSAQRQLVTEGRIHSYLRMLWGKKILEWSPTPRGALDVMLHLNDKYALDGRDPNSVSGIFWVLGRYDRAWGPEREVFGKIRFMSSENTARKVPVRGYVKTYSPPAEQFSEVRT